MFASLVTQKHIIMKRFLAILIISIITASCSNTLSKDEALTILKTEFKQECIQPIITHFRSTEKEYATAIQIAEKLESQGYITITRTENPRSHYSAGWTDIYINPTDMVQHLLAKKGGMSGAKYVVANSDVLQVTGIAHSNDNMTATVTFTYRYIGTELFDLRNYNPLLVGNRRTKDCADDVVEQQIELIKYDTGWKLKQAKSELYN